jgi:hypothetical protein
MTPRGLALWGLALVLAAPASLQAHEPFHFFLEKTYFFPGPTIFGQKVLARPDYYTAEQEEADDGDVFFEAQPAPHITFIDQVDGDDLLHGTTKRQWVGSVVFLTRLRLLGGFSSPLRSPSFMPRFTVQWLGVKRSDKQNAGDWAGDIRVDGPTVVLWGHHSNGGPGCLFLESRIEDSKCITPIPAEEATVNTRGGSFSTNYVRLGWSWLFGRIEFRKGFGNLLVHSWTISPSVELNPPGYGPGALDDDQRKIYGAERFKIEVERQQFLPLGRIPLNLALSGSYEYIRYDAKPSPDASPHRVIVDLVAIKQTGKVRGWGLAARYYRGQDFYNLLFIRDIQRFQLGLAYDPAARVFVTQ